MSTRVVYGNSFSEDGWPMVDEGSCQWITVPGTNPAVSLQIQQGWPLAILRAFAADFNAYVEPLRDADSACWTATNSVASSNHLSGTACDFNWGSHPFQVSYAGFDQAKIATVRDLLDFYEQCVWWGQDWDSPKDPMHFQCGGDTYNNPATGDFINRKIRADGFSTFRRDNVPVPPPPTPVLSKSDGYSVLIIQEGQRRGITPRGIQIALATGLVESSILVYANAKVPDSMNIPHDAVGSDGYSVGIFQQQVRDSGNGWWWGSAATCMDPTSSAGLFYDRLARLDYNGPNSPGSYAQAVQSSAFPDRYDQRFGDAVAIYNRLATTAPPTQGEDDLSAEAERQIGVIYQELTKRFNSRSRLRHLGEGPVETLAGFVLNMDSNQHVELVKLLAGYGHPPTLTLLREVAGAKGDARYPDRQDDADLAMAVLADVTSAPVTTVVNNAVAAPVQPQIVYVDRPVAAPEPAAALPAVVDGPITLGNVVKTVVDAVEQLKLADALTIQDRATLAASIKILEMKNGSQI